MSRLSCDILMTDRHYRLLMEHLFPGDADEHAAVLKAGLVEDGSAVRLLVREVHLARDGSDWIPGKIGYRALQPSFIHRQITSCRDERLVYLAVHNHHSDERVEFSRVDMQSHETGYPALLDIAKGMPVGALVFGHRSIQADLWMPNGDRRSLRECRVIGSTLRTITSKPAQHSSSSQMYDRQTRMFGAAGQQVLHRSKIAVIGLGGVGSLVAEYLARLGVGNLVLIDPDTVEESNLSRVVGATQKDAEINAAKTAVALRHVREARNDIEVSLVQDDVAKCSVASRLRTCDFAFLAADSMRARLVFNALVHQYFVPGVQIGAKVRGNEDGSLEDAMSVVRQVRPGIGCLWCNQLIDATQLAIEAKTDAERKAQAYGTHEPNPSVLSLNAVAAAQAVNDFIFDYLNLRPDQPLTYKHFHFLRAVPTSVHPRKDEHCRECGSDGGRFGMGDSMPLPCIEG